MNTTFPNHLFDFCGSKSKFDFEVYEGKKICKNKNILFCGIIRNAEKYLERNILCYIRTAKEFKKSRLFLYENDSSDSTVKILKKYESETINFISDNRDDKDYNKYIDTGKDLDHFNRCNVLAKCRNIYIDKINKEKWNKEYDFICVVDMDIKGGWSYDGFYQSIYLLENITNAACISAYGIIADAHHQKKLEDVASNKYIFYDTFAFRTNICPKIEKKSLFLLNHIKYIPGEDLEEVISNFNGLAIYKSKYITENTKYASYKWQDGVVDPDHVNFHKSIINMGGKIYINPSLIVSYSEHQYCE